MVKCMGAGTPTCLSSYRPRARTDAHSRSPAQAICTTDATKRPFGLQGVANRCAHKNRLASFRNLNVKPVTRVLLCELGREQARNACRHRGQHGVLAQQRTMPSLAWRTTRRGSGGALGPSRGETTHSTEGILRGHCALVVQCHGHLPKAVRQNIVKAASKSNIASTGQSERDTGVNAHVGDNCDCASP